jgi:hypothetical protein
MGATDKQQSRSVFSTAKIIADPALQWTIPFRWVRMPEWGADEVCVWGTRLDDTSRIADEIRLAGDDTDKAEQRRIVATVIQCCRDGEGAEAKRVFGKSDWEWLAAQPTSALNRIVNAVQELDASGGIRERDIYDFFVMMQALESALSSIASACGCSIDSRASSQEIPLPVRFASLCSQIVSSLNGKTDTSVTTA